MTLIYSWFHLAFSTLVASQVVLSAVLQPTEDTVNTYTYLNDGSIVLNTDSHNLQNSYEEQQSVKHNDNLTTDMESKESLNTESEKGSVLNDDEGSSEETGSLLQQLFSYINGGEEECELVNRSLKKRAYPHDMYEDEPRYYEDSKPYKRESKMNRQFLHSQHSRLVNHNRLQYSDHYEDDEEELEDGYDEDTEHDDIDEDHDRDHEHEHEAVENVEEDHEVKDNDAETEPLENVINTKHMKEYRKKLPKHIEQGLIDVDDDTLLAFSKFLENVMTVQMKNATRANNNSEIANKNPSLSPISTKPNKKISLDTTVKNRNVDKNNDNVETNLETEIHHDNERSGSESRVARNVIMEREPDISDIFDKFNIKDSEDERMFRHTRHETPPSTRENECDQLFRSHYDDFIKHNENAGHKGSFDYMTNHQDYNFGYHYPSIKCWEKPYISKCKNTPPIVMFRIDKINNDCNLEDCSRNFRPPCYGNVDYASVITPGMPPVVGTKYKRDLERVENLDSKVNQANELTTENEVVICNKYQPHEREIVCESVSLHAAPVLTYDSEQREPSTEVYKFDDIYEQSEPLKSQIEMIPNNVITYLMNNIMHKVNVSSNRTNDNGQTGMVINVYNDEIPKIVQKRDLNNRYIQSIDDCNNPCTSTNALASIQNLIAYQLARCPDLTNGNLTETDRRELCKNVVVKVLSNISDEHVIQQIVENYELRNCGQCPGCGADIQDSNSLPCSCGETNDDFEKTFINIKNLNIFYEFGESGQNCINMPNKRVQYTLPKHPANPATRRLCTPRKCFPDHLQNNVVIDTTHSNQQHQITFVQPQPTSQPNIMHDKVAEVIKPLIENTTHTRLNLHENDVADDKIAHKREHKITENDEQKVTKHSEANKQMEMHPYVIDNDNRFYANHNVKPFIAEEPSLISLENKSGNEEEVIQKHEEETKSVIPSKKPENASLSKEPLNHKLSEEMKSDVPSKEQEVSKSQDVNAENSFQVSDKETIKVEKVDNTYENIENTTESTNKGVIDTEIKEYSTIENNPVVVEEPVVVTEEVVDEQIESPKEELTEDITDRHDDIPETGELLTDSIVNTQPLSLPETTETHTDSVVNNSEVSDDIVLQNPIKEEKLNSTENEEHNLEELTKKPTVDFGQPIALILNKGAQINAENTHEDNTNITLEPELLKLDVDDIHETEVTSQYEDNHLINHSSDVETLLNKKDELKTQEAKTEPLKQETEKTEASEVQEEDDKEGKSFKHINEHVISGNTLDDDSIVESKAEDHILHETLHSEVALNDTNKKLIEPKIEHEHHDSTEEEEIANKSIESEEVKTLHDIGSLKEITHSENNEEREQGKREIHNNDEASAPSNGKYQSLIYKSEIDESEEKLESGNESDKDSKVVETNKGNEHNDKDMRSEEIGTISESDDNNGSNNNDNHDYLDDNRFCTACYDDIEENDSQFVNTNIDERETEKETEDEKESSQTEKEIEGEDVDEDESLSETENASKLTDSTIEDASEIEKPPIVDDHETRDTGEDNSPNNDEIRAADAKEESEEETRDGNVLIGEEPEDNQQLLEEQSYEVQNKAKSDLVKDNLQVEIEDIPVEDSTTENEKNDKLDNIESDENGSQEENVNDKKETHEDEENNNTPVETIENKEEIENAEIEDVEVEDHAVSESGSESAIDKDLEQPLDVVEPTSYDNKHINAESTEEHEDLDKETINDDMTDELDLTAHEKIDIEEDNTKIKPEDHKVLDIEEYQGKNKPGSKRNVDEVTNNLDVEQTNENHNIELLQSPENPDDDLLGDKMHVHDVSDKSEKELYHLGEDDAEYVKRCDVEKLIMEILESKPHPEHNIRHKNMLLDRHSKPDKKYQELVKDIASYFAKKNITSGDDICVYEEYGSKRGDDDVIILSGTKLYQNGVTKKDGQNFNLIIKKPHNSDIKPTAYDYVEYRSKNEKNKKSVEELKRQKNPLIYEEKYEKRPLIKRASYYKKPIRVSPSNNS